MTVETMKGLPAWAGVRRLDVHVTVDWTGPGHYDPAALPCRLCGNGTHERDECGNACDKACLEDVLARELIGQADTWIRDERFPDPVSSAPVAVLAGAR
jgi:hypothetical protein